MDGQGDEQGRAAVLRGYGLLDTPNEAAFDQIVLDTKHALNMPIVLISLIDTERQWVKARVGLDVVEIPLCISFCTHALQGRDVFVVPDARRDERFVGNPLVTGAPFVRFYAGAPLIADRERRIGTLCVLDTRPRADFSAGAAAKLAGMAAQTMAAAELRNSRIRERTRAA